MRSAPGRPQMRSLRGVPLRTSAPNVPTTVHGSTVVPNVAVASDGDASGSAAVAVTLAIRTPADLLLSAPPRVTASPGSSTATVVALSATSPFAADPAT